MNHSVPIRNGFIRETGEAMFENPLRKWNEKRVIDKAGDILFLIFILVMLVPSGRRAITVGVKRIFAFAPREISESERSVASSEDFYWPMETLDGRRINLEQYKGNTLFINEWATWCPPCIAEMPSIQKLYDKLKDEGVIFIIVTNEERAKVEAFMGDNGYTFPVLLSRATPPGPFFSQSIPATFLVAPSGEIVIREVGSRKWHGDETVSLIRSLK